ncbi:MAG TPA: hypothetical protein VMF88_13295 [Bacteroidota bacterium]|nr:hypothetical protein [Bacteroidota bacterium]
MIEHKNNSGAAAVDCREFHELISEAVDKRLHAAAADSFAAHAGACRSCRNEFEMERLTKSIVHEKVRRQTVPGAVFDSVLAEVDRLRPVSRNRPGSFWGEAFLNPAVALVALLLVAVGAVSLLQKDNAIPISSNKNIISQSVNNYSAAMTGTLKPSLVSHDPDDIKDYLAKGTAFDVSVAYLDGCDWCGGILSDVDGVRLVHVVYKIGGEGLLYVYQVDMNEAMKGNKVGLPENAKASLTKTGWYFEQTPDRCNVVLWRHKNTLCAAVSKIDRSKMIALLGEKDPW